MVHYNRIMHTPDIEVNDCPNEFLTVRASRVSKLEDMGFREIGKTWGLLDGNFKKYGSWIPRLSVCPVKGLFGVDSTLKSRIRNSLDKIKDSRKLDGRAVDMEHLANELASAAPVAGDLWLIDYTYNLMDTSIYKDREVFFIHPKDGMPVFRASGDKKGIHLWRDSGRVSEFIDPKNSMIAHLAKSYPLKVDSMKKIGEMEIAPVFLRNARVSPRIGSGSIDVGPHMSIYGDFEKYVKSKNK